jgi:hypothetical protein
MSNEPNPAQVLAQVFLVFPANTSQLGRSWGLLDAFPWPLCPLGTPLAIFLSRRFL